MSVFLNVSAPRLEDLVGGLKSFRADQLPFALSVAMNRAAKDAKAGVRSHLQEVFELRSRGLPRTFGPFGRMGDTSGGWSSKRQWPNLRVVLPSIAHAMALQEEGGIKPQKASEVWIPTRYVERSANGKAKHAFRPSTIKTRLEGTQSRRSGQVFWRDGNRVMFRDRGSDIARPAYFIHRRAVVPPRLEYERYVRDVYRSKLFPRFSQEMEKAIRSAKRRR